MVQRKLDRRCRVVTEGGGKATTKKPNGTAFERTRESRKRFACWPKTDWPTV